MTNKTKQVQNELRQMVFEAVSKDIITPDEVIQYIMDNGWKYDEPSKPTIIHLLAKNGVEYISGWQRVK